MAEEEEIKQSGRNSLKRLIVCDKQPLETRYRLEGRRLENPETCQNQEVATIMHLWDHWYIFNVRF